MFIDRENRDKKFLGKYKIIKETRPIHINRNWKTLTPLTNRMKKYINFLVGE